MTIIFGLCNEATTTEIALGATYNVDCQAGNLIKFLKQTHTVYFRSNDKRLSFTSYKQVVAAKSTNNYSNNKPHDPHSFKEEVKIKYDAAKAVVRRFPNGTGATMELLGATVPPIDWVEYCQLTSVKQLT